MKSILTIADQEGILKRIHSITKDDNRLWGKMTAHEMLCHTADQLRMAQGSKRTVRKVFGFKSRFMKFFVLLGIPAPKGKVETVRELKQGLGGTPPTTFEQDKEILIDLVLRLESSFEHIHSREHPAFGDLTRFEWGKLAWGHLDHHLRQFGR